MTTDFSTAVSTFDLASIADTVREAESIRTQILTRFPLDQWPAMPLEQYALGASDEGNSFCYWMEFKSRVLGSIKGGSSGKHLIFKRRDGSGWDYPKGFADEQQAWAAIRGEYVSAFERARADDWEAIDRLPNVSTKAILLKSLFLYFPERILPVYSFNHLLHFLHRLGAPKRELNGQGRVALNRRLLGMLRAQPHCAGWSGLQLMHFLYQWAPLPVEAKPDEGPKGDAADGLAPPFDQMFADEDEANWAFDFLANAARQLLTETKIT